MVGAPFEDGGLLDNEPQGGAAYVFERDMGGANSWGQSTVVRSSDKQTLDYFGQGLP